MPTQVLMPQLGESVDEGTITKWLKSKGEAITEFEPLLEVNTDKVDTEVPSPAGGVLLEILAQEGQTVRAGEVLALIGVPGEALAPGEPPVGAGLAPTQIPGAVATAQTAPAPAAQAGDMGFLSPVVRRMAREHNLDLSQIQGSGLGGRITKHDVQAFLENQATVPGVGDSRRRSSDAGVDAKTPTGVGDSNTPLPASAALGRGRGAGGAGLPQTAAEDADGNRRLQEGEVLPLSNVRRAIAEHMVHSKHTSPHVTTVMEVDLSRVVAHRQANKDAFARDGANLTFTAYFVSATVAALKAHPLVNSSWTEAGILLHKTINLGMATSLGADGLIVPVIKNAESLSLLGLARAINDLAARARARRLKPDEVKGGTFTLTNHGISGSLFASPIINQPQCGILGVGAIQKRVVVVSDPPGNDAIAIRPMAYVSLTFDHRILDGASADDFLAKVVESLNDWK